MPSCSTCRSGTTPTSTSSRRRSRWAPGRSCSPRTPTLRSSGSTRSPRSVVAKPDLEALEQVLLRLDRDERGAAVVEQDRRQRPAAARRRARVRPGSSDAQAFFEAINGAARAMRSSALDVPAGAESVADEVGRRLRDTDRVLLMPPARGAVFLPGGGEAGVASVLARIRAIAVVTERLPGRVRHRARRRARRRRLRPPEERGRPAPALRSARLSRAAGSSGLRMASRVLWIPTVPSTAILVPTPTPAMRAPPEEQDRDRCGAVDEDELDRGSVVSGATRTDRTRPATFTRSRQRGLGDRDAARAPRHAVRLRLRRWRASGGSTRAALAGGAGATGDDGRERHPLLVPSIEVEGHRRDVGVGQAGQLLEERVGGLVVQHPVPDAPVLAVGEEHGHLGLPVGELPHDALHRGSQEAAVGAVDDLERHAVQTRAGPLLGQLRGGLLVHREVHGAQLVGRERAGVLDGAGRRHVEAVDEHQHDVAPEDRRGGGGGHVVLEQPRLVLVLAVQPQAA